MIPEAYALERVPVERLSGFVGNPRTHSDEQVAQIAASITEFGWTNPILVDAEGVIIAGHGRLEAAKRLNMSEVPVIRLGHLSKAQRRALVVADNQLALNAGWDEQALSALICELDAETFDLDLLGFDDADFERYLAGIGVETECVDPDEVSTLRVPPDPVSRPGDLWVLENHRLLCGDATVLADVERLMNGSLADMVFTDPPYNVDYGNTPKDKLRGKDRKILNDALGEGFYQFLYDACVNLLMVTKGACYVCMSSSELHTLQRAWISAGGKWSTFIIWAKDTFTLGRSDYQRQYEPLLYGWKQGADHYWCGARDQGDVWLVNRPRINDLHPTMKPVALIERAIRNSSKTRHIVLDLFAGSGTTLIACEMTNRQARAMELHPGYVDVIIGRWHEFSGKEAVLDGDGRTFGEVKGGRLPAPDTNREPEITPRDAAA